MQIEYFNDEKEQRDFFKHLIWSRVESRLFVHVVLVIALSIMFAGEPFNWLTFAIALLIVTSVYISGFYFIPLFLSHRGLRKAIDNGTFIPGRRSVTVTEDGLLLESEVKSNLWRWEAMGRIEATLHFIYVVMADKSYLLLPKSAFASEPDAVAFMGMVQRKLYGAKIVNVGTMQQKSRPPYLLGLICIIPLIGAIVGFALILYGIIKYKDKWLVLIGAGGILWSVLIYGSMFWLAGHGDSFKRGWVPIAQTELNDVVKGVEFYKIEHGSYPDSLQQLEKENNSLSIWDPTQTNLEAAKRSPSIIKKLGITTIFFLPVWIAFPILQTIFIRSFQRLTAVKSA